MVLIIIVIFLSLILIISGITNIQYYKKNIELINKNIQDKKDWDFEYKQKNKSIDKYLNSLKSRFEKEYDSLKNKKKRGYMKGYYTQLTLE